MDIKPKALGYHVAGVTQGFSLDTSQLPPCAALDAATIVRYLLGSTMLKRDHPFPRRARLSSFDYRGPHAYFLTINARDRCPVFVEGSICAMVRRALVEGATRFSFQVHAYCFMPDHLHLLVAGMREDSDLRRFLRHFKQATGYAYKRAYGHRLWAYSYYDHVLRREESVQNIASYLLANPVRGGLVQRYEDYPYSACHMLGKHFQDAAQAAQ